MDFMEVKIMKFIGWYLCINFTFIFIKGRFSKVRKGALIQKVRSLGASIKDVHTPWGGGGTICWFVGSCTICRQGGGGGFPNCVRTHFSRRLFTEVTTYDKKVCKYLWKIEEKIVNTQKLNLWMGGVNQKCTFVDKGEGGVKNAQKCVFVFYGCPQICLNRTNKTISMIKIFFDLIHLQM